MPAPANDNLASATAITGISGTLTGTTVDATTDNPYDPLVDYYASGDCSVHYILDLPGGWEPTSIVHIEATSDVQCSVLIYDATTYPPTSISDWTALASDSSDNQATYTGAAPGAGFFYIEVDALDGSSTGAFTLSWEISLSGTDPVGVSIAFESDAFDTVPNWTRLDA